MADPTDNVIARHNGITLVNVPRFVVRGVSGDAYAGEDKGAAEAAIESVLAGGEDAVFITQFRMVFRAGS